VILEERSSKNKDAPGGTQALVVTATLPVIERARKIALEENAETQLEYMNSLPSTSTGKQRYVISEVE
jgi:hypothetical protein